MNKLSIVYGRILMMESSFFEDYTIGMEKWITKELEKVYAGYLSDRRLQRYINRQIHHMSNKNVNYHNLRSNVEMRENFFELYSSLLDTLYKGCDMDIRLSVHKWELGNHILGYIHLRNIHFQDEILNNADWTLVGNMTKFILYNSESKEIIHEEEMKQNFMYKVWGAKKGKRYAIPFTKTIPQQIIKIAMYDPEIMLKTHHLYLEMKTFLNLTVEQQSRVKEFVNNRKNEHIKIFSKTKDGVYPLITKDVMGLINEMIYPELDISKRINKILKECEDLFEYVQNLVENKGSGNVEQDSQKFLGSIVGVISFFLNSCDNIRNLKTHPFELRQELLQVSSYIWKFLKLDIVRHFTKSHIRFYKVVEEKRKELRRDVTRWKEEGEDVDWFLELLLE